MKRRGPLAKVELAPNQSKITSFFKKAPTAVSVPAPAPLRTSAASTNAHRRALPPDNPFNGTSSAPSRCSWSDVEGDILEVTVVPKPPPSPKPLVVINSSSSDEEEDIKLPKSKNNRSHSNSGTPTEQAINANTSCHSPSSLVHAGQNTSDNNNLRNDKSSEVDFVEIVTIEDCYSSSGDEVLSQIDIDEMIRSSQSSIDSPVQADDRSRSSDGSSTVAKNAKDDSENPPPEKENVILSHLDSPSSALMRRPRKTAKSKATKFSPIRRLAKLKRTRSQTSLGRSSSSSSTPTPSPNKKRNNELASPKRMPKRLSFGNEPPSVTTGSPSKQQATNQSPQKSPQKWGSAPYYLKNFLKILADVMGDQYFSNVLNSEDRKVVELFMSLSEKAQCLYVRLFQRKWHWRPESKLNNNYRELPENVGGLCQELTRVTFFEQISVSNSSLEEVLNALDLNKMTALCKKLKVTSVKKTKEALKVALLDTGKSQPTLTGQCGTAQALKMALTELGPAFRVSPESKLLFSRLFLLHSPPQYWEVEVDQAANQLLLVLLNTMGQMEYASYKVQKSAVIFLTRDHLICFHEAFMLHSNLVGFTEAHDWDSVIEISIEARSKLYSLLHDEANVALLNHEVALPGYLRVYTAGSILCHTCWLGVNGYQKLKRFAEANDLIRFLMRQTTYLTNYRGRMWERLAINSCHLKQTKIEIRSLLEESLADPFLKEHHQLILTRRLIKARDAVKAPPPRTTKVKKSKPCKRTKPVKGKGKKKYIDTSSSSETESSDEDTFVNAGDCGNGNSTGPPLRMLSLKHQIATKTITGEKVDRGPKLMGKSVFLGKPDASGASRLSSVEEHTIDYYLEKEGYTKGLHGEGSTVCSVYGLLFWDVIFYDHLQDAFHTCYQPFPLDFHFNDFYERRKVLIDEKLALIRDVLSMEDLVNLVEEVWQANEKKMSIVNWSLGSVELLKSLMKAMGSEMIAKICERLATNYRNHSSGFPDLVMWNEAKQKVIFVEVKGPGDSLSPKQELWLDFLVDNGINAEVCHVKAVSNKRI